ncbi:MAG: 1-acyl-sn-glycerol-3-phosphate acyltransferase [Bacteroidaceae bacterium]|nr:1-acyl-sn-glycerol-3-phosphate acyltransferase [Bacteroidaceae bacterium]MBR1755062.1 1-acyl-sn-glycerol-3-phosphate acyltransferase [Bacteroidaceae bacterium]
MKLLYRLYQLLISPVLLVLTILTALATIIGCSLLDASWWSYYPGRLWSRAMVRLLLLPVHIEGREHMDAGQSYVIIPNHQGTFDIFLIYGFLNRPFKWMMKEELRKMPFIGKACDSAGFIFVDQKGGPRKMLETHKRARAVLQDGVSLVVFPEGARTWDGRLRRFKRGAFQLADELQLPLLPITINGSFEALPRTRGYVNFVHWHPLTLTIHPAILPSEKSGDEVVDGARERQTMQEAYEIIASRLTTVPHAPAEGTYNPND